MTTRGRALLRWLEWTLYAIALPCMGAGVLALSEQTYYHSAARAVLEAADSSAGPAAGASAPVVTTGDRVSEVVHGTVLRSPAAATARSAPRVRNAVLVGELAIPHLRVSAAVLEGDDAATLRRGAGHLPGTPLPWEPGNVVVAGHRDTVFRRLGDLHAGDRMRLTTVHGTFDYRVSRILRVKPRDVWVLRSDAAALTLITCYPFTWIGSAPERWVVQAEKVDDWNAGTATALTR